MQHRQARPGGPGPVFLSLGVAFLAPGIAGQPGLLAVAPVFLTLGALFLVRAPRRRNPDA